MAQEVEASTCVGTKPWFCICGQLQLEVSMATLGPRDVLSPCLRWVWSQGSREMATNLVLFLYVCVPLLVVSHFYMIERNDWKCVFGCHREFLFMNTTFWLFLISAPKTAKVLYVYLCSSLWDDFDRWLPAWAISTIWSKQHPSQPLSSHFNFIITSSFQVLKMR